MKVNLSPKVLLITILIALCYYVSSRCHVNEKKVTKKVIDKGYVGDRYGNVKHFVVFQYEDGTLRKRDVMVDSYYHYKKGKKYIEQNSYLTWK